MRQVKGGAGGAGGLPQAALRTVLVVSATHRDHRELKRLYPSGIDFRFHDYASTADRGADRGGRAGGRLRRRSAT